MLIFETYNHTGFLPCNTLEMRFTNGFGELLGDAHAIQLKHTPYPIT